MVDERQPYNKMPVERSYPNSWKKIGLLVLGTVLLVYAVNFFVLSVLVHMPTSRTDKRVKLKWELAQNQRAPLDWVVLGDSSANQGVDPEILEEAFGGEALNLATLGGWVMLDDVWLLEELIERAGAPENVLLVHVYDIYHRDLNNQVLVQSPVGMWRWYSFGVALELTPAEVYDLALQRALPMYFRSDAIQDYYEAVFVEKTAEVYQGWQKEVTNGFERRLEANPERVENSIGEQLDWLEENQFEVSAINLAVIEQLSYLCESYEFDIFVANAPIVEDLYKETLFQAYFVDVQAFLDEWDQTSECVHYLDNAAAYPAEVMENADHLTYDGAEMYTRDVIEVILGVKTED